MLGGASTGRSQPRLRSREQQRAPRRADAEEIEEHVLVGEKQRAQAQFEEVPLALQIPRRRGSDEQRAAQAAGVFCRGTCAALQGACTTTVACVNAASTPLRK